MQSLSSDKWALGTEEVGYYVGKDETSTSSSSYKVYIPKIIPLINQGIAKDTNESLSRSCFKNAAACMVTPKNTVTTANYVIVSTQNNQGFVRPVLKMNARLQIKVANKSLDQLYVTNLSDQSDYSAAYKIAK